MYSILDTYDTISLEEMKKVRLMNRIDTKYVMPAVKLPELLEAAKIPYMVQQIDGQTEMPYYTLYFETPDTEMYLEHLRGRKRRQKIRIRRYESSGLSFLEIKNKNNKGRTDKVRIPCRDERDSEFSGFITGHSHYDPALLSRRIENRFTRITLVGRSLSERITIDTCLSFRNLLTSKSYSMGNLAIIELKRDSLAPSPIREILRQMHVHEASFSKYCIGMALTDNSLRTNRFKPRLRSIARQGDIIPTLSNSI